MPLYLDDARNIYVLMQDDLRVFYMAHYLYRLFLPLSVLRILPVYLSKNRGSLPIKLGGRVGGVPVRFLFCSTVGVQRIGWVQPRNRGRTLGIPQRPPR